MPILEYRCGKCGKEFEWLKLASNEEPVCPHCGGDEFERLLSTFAVGPGARSAPACSDSAPCAGEGDGCKSCRFAH